jgi:hypothetical protein
MDKRGTSVNICTSQSQGQFQSGQKQEKGKSFRAFSLDSLISSDPMAG